MAPEILFPILVSSTALASSAYYLLQGRAARLHFRMAGLPEKEKGRTPSRRRLSPACRRKIEAEWPAFLEAMVVALTAGLELPDALHVASQMVEDPLHTEMQRVLLDVKTGKPVYRCLGGLSARLGLAGVSRFHFVLSQAELLGTPLAETCTLLAEESYREMAQDMEYRLNTLPVKLAVVTSLLLLPPVVLVTVGPGVLAFLGGW